MQCHTSPFSIFVVKANWEKSSHLRRRNRKTDSRKNWSPRVDSRWGFYELVNRIRLSQFEMACIADTNEFKVTLCQTLSYLKKVEFWPRWLLRFFFSKSRWGRNPVQIHFQFAWIYYCCEQYLCKELSKHFEIANTKSVRTFHSVWKLQNKSHFIMAFFNTIRPYFLFLKYTIEICDILTIFQTLCYVTYVP